MVCSACKEKEAKRLQIEKKEKTEPHGAATSGNDTNGDSKLRVFFANVTYLGEKALAYLTNRTDHVLMVVETHLREANAHKTMNSMSLAGWNPIMAPAVASDESEHGTKGGAMLFHKPWLQTATPAIADDPLGRTLPEDDLAWKHIRISGFRLVLATIYFQHSTGLADVNLDKFGKAVITGYQR